MSFPDLIWKMKCLRKRALHANTIPMNVIEVWWLSFKHNGFRWVVDREFIGFMNERRVCDWRVCDGGIGCSSKLSCSSDDWEKGEKVSSKSETKIAPIFFHQLLPKIPVFYHFPSQKASMGFFYNYNWRTILKYFMRIMSTLKAWMTAFLLYVSFIFLCFLFSNIYGRWFWPFSPLHIFFFQIYMGADSDPSHHLTFFLGNLYSK